MHLINGLPNVAPVLSIPNSRRDIILCNTNKFLKTFFFSIYSGRGWRFSGHFERGYIGVLVLQRWFPKKRNHPHKNTNISNNEIETSETIKRSGIRFAVIYTPALFLFTFCIDTREHRFKIRRWRERTVTEGLQGIVSIWIAVQTDGLTVQSKQSSSHDKAQGYLIFKNEYHATPHPPFWFQRQALRGHTWCWCIVICGNTPRESR